MNSFIKSRKRTRNPTKHKTYIRKQSVQKGEQRTTKAGNIIEKKSFQPQVACQCNGDRQNQIFSAYYNLENWTQKTLFLRTLTKTVKTKENLNPKINLKERNFSHQHYLSDQTGVQHQVCLTFLLNCLQIARTTLFNASKSTTSNEIAKDNRGNRVTKRTSENDISFVKDCINSFPTYESHYKISKSDRKYLNPCLTIMRMYREYCLKCTFNRKKPN